MQLITLEQWDDTIWRQVKPVYEEAFPHGAKTETVLRRVLDQGIGRMHVCHADGNEDDPAAMAVTGVTSVDGHRALVIDYLAVRSDRRGRGVGREFLGMLAKDAVRNYGAAAVVIEVEADDTPENRNRMRFWESCGFQPTAYVHTYRWVPEPYRAMVLQLCEPPALPEDGEYLFRYIISFHEKAYRRR